MKVTKTATTLVAAAMMTVLVGCGSDEPTANDETGTAPSSAPAPETSAPPSSEPAPATQVTITIEDFKFSDPGPIAPGTEITVENKDEASHTVTAEDTSDFDVTIGPGETATFTAPSEPGEYPYVCTFHASMTSTLVVQ